MSQLDVTAPVTTRAGTAPGPAVGSAPAVDLPVDIVDQWGAHSFPASDPPANW